MNRVAEFDRPHLLFPEAEGRVLLDHYLSARVVLEYGSGGSTLIATEQAKVPCFSVESDAAWAAGMISWLDRNVPRHRTKIHHADIGETGDWGFPADARSRHLRRFRRYARSVWARPDFCHPDVVLIDGRFRVDCFLAVMTRIDRPVVVLFDDYSGRDHYREVERFCRPCKSVGRMAIFEVAPRRLRPTEFLSSLRYAHWPQ